MAEGLGGDGDRAGIGTEDVQTEDVQVEVLRCSSPPRPEMPRYMSEHASGFDLAARLEHDVELAPFERALVPTGLRLAIPKGFEGQVRPRSGLAARHGITILNTPGTIDSDYRGEIQVILINLSSQLYTIRHGDRVAQLVIAPVVRAKLVDAEGLDATGRGEGGFGSTGVSDGEGSANG